MISKYFVFVERVVILDRAYSYASFTRGKVNNIYQLVILEGEFIENKI